MLRRFADDVWLADGPVVAVAGFHYPTRMAVIRLADGGLFVWSPVALTNALAAAVSALGEVRHLVTPTRLHNLYLAEWKSAWPQAMLYAAPGSRKRSPHIAFDADLDDEAPSEWSGEIDQVPMRGNLIAVEVAFFHRKSGTLFLADLIQHFEPGWFAGWRTMIARLDGMTAAEPKVPAKFRFAFADRRAARRALAAVLRFPVERVVMAHCPVVEKNGRAFVERAFRWLS